MKNIIQHDLRFPIGGSESEFTPSSKALVRGLLEPTLTDRIGCRKDLEQEIRDSAWFEGFNWHGVVYRESPPPWQPKLRGAEDVAHF